MICDIYYVCKYKEMSCKIILYRGNTLYICLSVLKLKYNLDETSKCCSCM